MNDEDREVQAWIDARLAEGASLASVLGAVIRHAFGERAIASEERR
jgi:hypothetical protein